MPVTAAVHGAANTCRRCHAAERPAVPKRPPTRWSSKDEPQRGDHRCRSPPSNSRRMWVSMSAISSNSLCASSTRRAASARPSTGPCDLRRCGRRGAAEHRAQDVVTANAIRRLPSAAPIFHVRLRRVASLVNGSGAASGVIIAWQSESQTLPGLLPQTRREIRCHLVYKFARQSA
jgi:hypothetical protein